MNTSNWKPKTLKQVEKIKEIATRQRIFTEAQALAGFRYPTCCDAPVDVITKKQALSAMNTLTQTLLILGEVYERN